jgi:hypothetical protein
MPSLRISMKKRYLALVTRLHVIWHGTCLPNSGVNPHIHRRATQMAKKLKKGQPLFKVKTLKKK